MTVVLVVLLLSIPVVILARKSPAIIVLAALWGFAVGMTPAGPAIAQLLAHAGAAVADLVA